VATQRRISVLSAENEADRIPVLGALELSWTVGWEWGSGRVGLCCIKIRSLAL
jgi:hypothetical protein